jgi:hypothetical protein
VLPAYIRYFAETSDTPLGRAALGFCKSLLRVAAVKLVSIPGGLSALQGEWQQFDELLLTPTEGSYVNVVCTHPSRWACKATIRPPTHVWNEAAGEYLPQQFGEPISGTIELYTVGVRNVLLVGKMPITKGDLITGAKYEAIVCQNVADMAVWKKHAPTCGALLVSSPGIDHLSIRAAVLGPSAEATP